MWGLISGLGRYSGGGMATHSSILSWRIPCLEEPGGLWSTELQKLDTTELVCVTVIVTSRL